MYGFVPTPSCRFTIFLGLGCLLFSIYIHLITLPSSHFMNNPSWALLFCPQFPKYRYSICISSSVTWDHSDLTDALKIFGVRHEANNSFAISFQMRACRSFGPFKLGMEGCHQPYSNFHSIPEILLTISLCLVSTYTVSIIIGNLGKV